jgi:serine/threonine protein phosphatase 1
MRTYVISDIHGNNVLFRKALKDIKLTKSDRLVLLGDLIDRGEDSKGVLDTVLLLIEHDFRVDLVRGNHEQMLLDALDSSTKLTHWLLNGGGKTLSSFLTSSIERIPLEYIEFIRTFKFYIEIDQYILVHAALNMKIENPFEDKQTMLWERKAEEFSDKDWLKGRLLVHGHNPIEENQIIASIFSGKQIVCIDNGSFLRTEGYGSICVFQLESKQVKLIK